MHGVMFIILEFYFKEKKGGLEVWHQVKRQAKCDVKDGGFVKRTYYGDQLFMDLIEAGAAVTNTDVMAEFGHYFAWFLCNRGASRSLMSVQGTTLRSWLSNLNGMHEHIQMSYPGGSSKASKFKAPEFWCEDGDGIGKSILLHYHSPRGKILVDFVPGTIIELARWQFDLEIEMTKLERDNDNSNNGGGGSDIIIDADTDFTTWRITAVDPSESWKLSNTCASTPRLRGVRVASIIGKEMSSRKLQDLQAAATEQAEAAAAAAQCPFAELHSKFQQDTSEKSNNSLASQQTRQQPPHLTLEQMQTIFPFHIMVDHNFIILSVGESLPALMEQHLDENNNLTMIGQHIGETVKITRPKVEEWEWKELKKFSDQNFSLAALFNNTLEDHPPLEFKGSMFPVGHKAVMFALNPFVRNVDEMRAFGLYMNHLPQHGFQRDSVFLGEYITHEVERAHELDQLSRKLELEQELSNTLLYNMLPTCVANKLRKGGTVEPMEHEHVTLFFSDIVGFTAICDQVDPWDVIDLLNQLYSVMDYLADKFKLYKVETIGDAYMCCSGLPSPDEYHAENVCNFAVAVLECVKHVISPVDDVTPINLRIGIHCGNCTAGVVGTRTPHYSLFGDMVNVSARHEQTGSPGKIQCSSELFGRLQHDSPYNKPQFHLTPRGLVEMKGKGERCTYWLEGGTDDNEFVNPTALNALFLEVGNMLEKKTWKMRRYFRSSGVLRGLETGSTISGGRSSLSDSVGSLTSAPAAEGMDATIREHEDDDDDDDDDDDVLENGGDHIILDNSRRQRCNNLRDLVFEKDLTRDDLVTEAYAILLPILELCMLDHYGKNASTLDAVLVQQLHGFIDSVSKAFHSKKKNPYHCFRRSVHVIAWSNRLLEQIQDGVAGSSGKIDPAPWYRLALTFAALLRDCKHAGVTDMQLQREGDPVYQIHGRNCQAKHSLSFGLDLLEERFPNLNKELRRGHPGFFNMLRKAALVTDPNQEFRSSMELPVGKVHDMAERTEATVGLVIRLADFGYFAQEFKEFEGWMEALFAEYKIANIMRRGEDPTQNWNEDCLNLFNQHVLPLVRLYEVTFPDSCRLQDAVIQNQSALAKKWLEVEKKGLFPRRTRSGQRNSPKSNGTVTRGQAAPKMICVLCGELSTTCVCRNSQQRKQDVSLPA